MGPIISDLRCPDAASQVQYPTYDNIARNAGVMSRCLNYEYLQVSRLLVPRCRPRHCVSEHLCVTHAARGTASVASHARLCHALARSTVASKRSQSAAPGIAPDMSAYLTGGVLHMRLHRGRHPRLAARRGAQVPGLHSESQHRGPSAAGGSLLPGRPMQRSGLTAAALRPPSSDRDEGLQHGLTHVGAQVSH